MRIKFVRPELNSSWLLSCFAVSHWKFAVSKFTILLLLAGIVGSTAGWAVNYYRYAHRDAFFGRIDFDGKVTAANLGEKLRESSQEKNPKVELVGDSTFDFGTMQPNEKGKHVFIVKNVGEGDLKLRVGASTCKCTLGSLEDDMLMPGEQTEVVLEWTVKTNESTFGQSAQLLTNDPATYAIDLKITGQVVDQMAMVPESLTFGEVAAGETFTLEGKIYSYIHPSISDPDVVFSSDELNELADVELTRFEPSEDDGPHSSAVEGYKITMKVKPGLKQGPISQNMNFRFKHPSLDESGESDGVAKDDNAENGGPDEKKDEESSEPSDLVEKVFAVSITGKVIGSISMIPNPRLKGSEGGNFIYDFGSVDPEGPFTAKTFVVLKGKDRDRSELEVKDTEPSDVVSASLGKPIKKASMTLYPLEIELKPGSKAITRLGRERDDYGKIRISTKDDQSKLVIGLKFSLEAK